LARRLRQYGVKSKTLRLGDELFAKGYACADLHDVWRRYLPPLPDKADTGVTPVTEPISCGFDVTPVTSPGPNVTAHDPDVTAPVEACDGSSDRRNADEMRVVTPVTPVTPLSGNGGDHTCAQCHGPVDGTEQQCSMGSELVWLHRACQRFYLDRVYQ
jgi:hypothetical protein